MKAAVLDESAGTGPSYRRLFELGCGGMARVYLAESLAFGLRKLVVLKVLNPEFCGDPAMHAAFQREAQLSAQMNHPNVVQVMAVIEQAGAPAIVMEYLDGTPLSSVLRHAAKQLPLRLQMHILSQALGGLHHFHELKDLDGTPLNAVHRDVSPQNVMILHDGPVKVLDFGIAKVSAPDDHATRAGTIKGKLQYMAPEQLLGGTDLDRRSDIFSAGVMLWEAAAGRRMWEGKTEIQVVRSLATGKVPDLAEVAPATPLSVQEIVRRAIDVDRHSRFATAEEMQVAIDEVLAREGWSVQPRELAEFMAEHFGESRRDQQERVKTVLRAMRSSERVHDPTSGTHLVRWPAERSSPEHSTPRVSGVAAIIAPRRASKPWWSWALAAVVCLGLLIAWGMWQRLQSAARPPATAGARNTVAFVVDALPPDADILLDGKRLASGHYVGEVPRSDAKAVLEVRSPGYLSVRREVTFAKDVATRIVLLRDAPAPRVPGSAASSASPASSTSSSPPRVSEPPLVPAKTKSQAVRRSAPSRHCDPPYTFGADGVKTYKAECF